MLNRTVVFLLALLVMPVCLHAGDALVLDSLLCEAESDNPELAGMKARYEAARESIPRAGALDDPMLGVGVTNLPTDSFAFDREPMTGKMVEVSQMLPYWGKRPLRREAAEREADALEAEYEDRRLAVRSEVKKAYYELYAVKKGLDIVDKNVQLMDVFTKLAETRYSVGAGTMRDVIKAQVETAMLVDRRLVLERDDKVKRAYMAMLLGRDYPVAGDVPDVRPTRLELDRDTLATKAVMARPALRSADYRVKKGRVMVELARREYYPDFTVSASYMQREDIRGGMEQSDMISARVSVNLPVWRGSKLDPMVREAALDVTMAERQKEEVLTGIYYMTGSLMDEVAQDDRIMRLYRDVLIPRGTDDMDSVLANYEVGKADFLDLLESRRTLYEFELTYYMTLAEREKSVAELEAATGVELQR